MDQNQIEQGLRDVLLAEPPLGIDPDRVADAAVRSRRNRRAGFATAAGVFVVAGLAAGTIAFTSGTSPGLAPASTPTSDRPQEPQNQVERNIAHLRAVLPGVMPDARDIKVSTDQEHGGTATMTVVVTFTDSAGPGTFNFTVDNIAGDYTPLNKVCKPVAGEKLKTHPDGTPLRCEKIRQPGGDTVVIEEDGLGKDLGPIVPTVTRLNAIDYRTGNLAVHVWNDRILAGSGDLRSRFPLSEAQLIKLVADPAFTLH